MMLPSAVRLGAASTSSGSDMGSRCSSTQPKATLLVDNMPLQHHEHRRSSTHTTVQSKATVVMHTLL
jgi:hypothetical protein